MRYKQKSIFTLFLLIDEGARNKTGVNSPLIEEKEKKNTKTWKIARKSKEIESKILWQVTTNSV